MNFRIVGVSPPPFLEIFKKRDRLAIVGFAGSGKTNSIPAILASTSGTYAHIVLVYTGDPMNEPVYRALNEHLGPVGMSCFTPDTLPLLHELLSRFENGENEILLIFDNLMEDVRDPRVYQKLYEYNSHPEYPITIVWLLQSIIPIGKSLWSQMTYWWLLHRVCRRDLKLVESDKLFIINHQQ